MPHTTATRRVGRALLAGLLGLSAATAIAADQASERSDVLVSNTASDTRSIAVDVSDLDFRTPVGRQELAQRVKQAANRVCLIMPGSAIDKLPSAQECLEDAQAMVLAQLETRGVPAAASLAASGMQ